MSNPELSIEQLADLKIVLNRTNDELKAAKDELAIVRTEHDQRLSESIRLKEDVNVLVSQKEQLEKDNAALREEKQGIQSKFEEESAKRYEEMRSREEAVSRSEGIVALRLIEIDKREKNLVAKANENDNKLVEARRVKEDASTELANVEASLSRISQERAELKETETRLAEIRSLVEASKADSEKALNDLNAKEKEIEEKSGKYASMIAELTSAEKRAKEAEAEMRRLLPVMEEMKAFIIEKTRKKGSAIDVSDLEAIMAGKTVETHEEGTVEPDEIPTTPADAPQDGETAPEQPESNENSEPSVDSVPETVPTLSEQNADEGEIQPTDEEIAGEEAAEVSEEANEQAPEVSIQPEEANEAAKAPKKK